MSIFLEVTLKAKTREHDNLQGDLEACFKAYFLTANRRLSGRLSGCLSGCLSGHLSGSGVEPFATPRPQIY